MDSVSACPFCNEPVSSAHKVLPTAQICACSSCFNAYILEWRETRPVTRPIENVGDIRQTAPPGSIGAAIFARLKEVTDQLPILPEISQKVLMMVRDPDVSMNDLAQVIRQDPVIAMSIMRLANSAMYGGLQEVKDLGAACARLGMRTIANTVQVVVNANLFVVADKRLQEFMKRLWRHSIAVAHCSSEIAALTAEPRGETLFLAGLTHDIGKVVLLQIIAQERSGIIADVRNAPDLLREVLDSFHSLVGLHAVQQWGLPAEFSAIIYAHHQPQLCPVEDWLPMAHTVCLGNLVSKIEGFGTYDEPLDAFLMNHPSSRYLNLSDIKLAALRVDLVDKLNALMEASGA